ncbi:CAP domain-containing protein [Cellulomonas edaphi]|uniref:SCP domain-containing protein n=1 Tax=Cellulomonas edaphi TaxID=3053468 RepID=A0ABT7S4Z5_9CELL|nr:hypothetical protein [Cellulomons edaphi]MDM7830589.1 hypothetical protein [Cellulomons edaphi]
MRAWDKNSRAVTAVFVTAAVIAAGASAAWSDTEGSAGSAPAPTATVSATPEPTLDPTLTAEPEPTAAPAPSASPTPSVSPTTAPVAALPAAGAGASTAPAVYRDAVPLTMRSAASTRALSASSAAAAKRAAAKKAAAKRAAAAKLASVRAAAIKAPARVPSGGLVCRGSGGAGAAEQRVKAIGAAINSYRKSHGLRTLRVSRSTTLVNHAKRMATTGGIWHSGRDNIVACVSDDSARTMVRAWAHSAPHKAQMLRRGVTRMTVGGAVNDGWLFGAVRFL